MISSFINLLLVGMVLCYVVVGGVDVCYVDVVVVVVYVVFVCYGDVLEVVVQQFLFVLVYFGSGVVLGVVCEVVLKMLEMFGGVVCVFLEIFFGLCYGLMFWLGDDCFVVVFFSGEFSVCGYEYDLLCEFICKGLGCICVVVGEVILVDVFGEGGVVIELLGFYVLEEVQQLMVYVVVGQLLVFFCCLVLGQWLDVFLQGVLICVVELFVIYVEGLV